MTLYTESRVMGKHNKVVKLTRRKISYIVRAKINNNSIKIIAAEMKVSKSTVKRVWMHWTKNHELLPIKKFGRKRKDLDEGSEHLILEVYKEQNLSAKRLEKVIEYKYGLHIPHNTIHQVLLKNHLAKEDKSKKKRRKPWVRYERDHSLSAVHLDWHTQDTTGKEVCAVLDDSSRYVLAGGEFDAATAENSIYLVQEVLDKFGYIKVVDEIITDRGTQFYANKKDVNGEGESSFSEFLNDNGIKHIVARVKHPQTNGKIEKWFDTYEKNRFRFKDFSNFVNWYNTVRYHSSLDTKHYLQTPEIAFWSRLPEESKLKMFLDRMENELNAK